MKAPQLASRRRSTAARASASSCRWSIDGVPIDALELYLGGAFVLVVEAGEVLSSSWYFTGKVNGVIGEAGVRYRFLSMLSVGIEVTYQHFFYDFDPEPTDAFIAGGALDQTVSAALVVGFVWGGES